MSKRPKLGATGKHVADPLRSDDGGQLRLAVMNYEGKVVVDFGTSVTWVAFSARETREFARALLEYARKAEGN